MIRKSGGCASLDSNEKLRRTFWWNYGGILRRCGSWLSAISLWTAIQKWFFVICLRRLMLFFLRSTFAPGVARQLLTFLVSPRKVSQRRRPQAAAPSEFPAMRRKKWEVNETRCAQTAFTSFSIFCSASLAASQRSNFSAPLERLLVGHTALNKVFFDEVVFRITFHNQ
jgi:hypothetical protein